MSDSSFPVVIRHAGKTHNVNIDLNEPGILFKSQIFSLTNVPPERQKVLVKGGQLKDDTDLKSLNLKANQTIMVLGTPDATGVPQKPKEEIVFLEDLEKQGKLVEFSGNPLGFSNLGNTCYLNSTLQALNTVPELKKSLNKYDDFDKLTRELKETFNRLQKGKVSGNGRYVIPLSVLTNLRSVFPQFAEQDHHGYKQQDAEECFSQILSHLRTTLPDDFINKYFGINFKTYQKCQENDPNDKEVIGYEDALKLSCHIDIHTNFLKTGLVEGSKDVLEKHNPTFDRNAQYVISKKITRLPKYLAVNFVRFYWKSEIRAKAKILRKVAFPFQLDVTDLLDESVKEQKVKTRDEIYKVEKEKEDEFKEARRAKKQKLNEDKGRLLLSNKEKFDLEEKEFAENEEKWLKEFKKVFPKDLGDGEAPSPLYDLSAVVTHKGASADSGHYQAFTKNEKDLTGNSWWFFNDDKVTQVGKDKVETLAGGGESDIALILIYKAVGL